MRRDSVVVAVCLGLVLGSLAWKVLGWLLHGLDLPFFDDWRGYRDGTIESLDPRYLFAPVNDTLTPIGFALDAMAQRLIHGHSVLYQLLSMLLVLGGLLLAQWRALSHTAQQRWMVAVLMLTTLLMLQPGSYWGRENMAYHQALPVLALATALCLLWAVQLRPLIVLLSMLLGLVAGFSYISGAFAALSAALALIVVGHSLRRWAPHQFAAHWPLAVPYGLALGSGLATLAQTRWVVLPRLGAGDAVHTGAALAWPTDPDFWWYALGKVGRSLGLDPSWGSVAFWITLIGIGLWLGVLGLLLLRLFSQASCTRFEARVTPLLLAWTAAIGIYLAMVALGRANYRPDHLAGSLEVFQFGFERFHFFWVTLVWPWVLAGLWALVAARRSIPNAGVGTAMAVALVPCLAWLMWDARLVDHREQFRLETYFRLPTVTCVQEGLQQGGPIHCAEFNMPDFRLAYLHGRDTNASFVRYFPLGLAATDFAGPQATWPASAVAVPPLKALASVPADWAWGEATDAGTDAQWGLEGLAPDLSADCRVLDVTLDLSVAKTDRAQLFYQPLGALGYSEVDSVNQPLQAGRQTVSWRIESARGFEARLRLDPVASPQTITLHRLQLQCRLPTRASLLRAGTR